jgi:hypothetical protein
MRKKQLLSFVSNKDLYRHVEAVLNIGKKASSESEKKFYKNVIDPFSALFDASCQGVALHEWIRQEKSRQTQKTLQNAIGEFHQNILGSISGWKNLGTGNIADLSNNKKKIIAEIKNKFNTTKGNHKTAIYEDFKNLLAGKYIGYTCYYVEIIPPAKKEYDNPFCPSDNRKGKRKPKNPHIRIIDGKSFYYLVSGEKNALEQLYLTLPSVIGDIFGDHEHIVENAREFQELFYRAY